MYTLQGLTLRRARITNRPKSRSKIEVAHFGQPVFSRQRSSPPPPGFLPFSTTFVPFGARCHHPFLPPLSAGTTVVAPSDPNKHTKHIHTPESQRNWVARTVLKHRFVAVRLERESRRRHHLVDNPTGPRACMHTRVKQDTKKTRTYIPSKYYTHAYRAPVTATATMADGYVACSRFLFVFFSRGSRVKQTNVRVTHIKNLLLCRRRRTTVIGLPVCPTLPRENPEYLQQQ